MKRFGTKWISILLCFMLIFGSFGMQEVDAAVWDSQYDAIRIAGDDRLVTSYLIADQLKEKLGGGQFDSVIVASGATFADALPGSYLAAKQNAPILLTLSSEEYENQTKNYIKAALKPGGTVYILGGESAVPATMERGLEAYAVKRVFGNNRFLTNLEILKEAVVGANEEILVCTGMDYADSLSASATGKPILLVNNKLTNEQKAYLNTLVSASFCVVGGENAVSEKIVTELSAYGEVERLSGANRLKTSLMVAERYFKNADSAVLAYAWNFPDGLCGGALAYAMDAPLILTHSKKDLYAVAAEYTEEKGIGRGFVLGGGGLVSDEAVHAIFGVKSGEIKTISKAKGHVALSSYADSTMYPNAGIFEVTYNVSGGELHVASSDEAVATASVCGNVVTVMPMGREGKAVITVTSASKGYYDEATAEFVLTVENNLLTVGEDKMYSTIQAAVDAAQDGDVILVYPGTYEEAVSITDKTLTLRGTDKESCVLTYPNGDYYVPPLEMASGTLENLTIHATAQPQKPNAVAKAYCLHTDYNILEGKKFYIENVDFINDDYQAVGIGLRAYSVLEFVNCNFICKGNSNAFFCHDDVKTAEDQCLIVRDCSFENNGLVHTIAIQSIEQAGSTVYATWINNTVKNNRINTRLIEMSFYKASLGGGNWLNSTNWTLTPNSNGNSLAALNYK